MITTINKGGNGGDAPLGAGYLQSEMMPGVTSAIYVLVSLFVLLVLGCCNPLQRICLRVYLWICREYSLRAKARTSLRDMAGSMVAVAADCRLLLSCVARSGLLRCTERVMLRRRVSEHRSYSALLNIRCSLSLSKARRHPDLENHDITVSMRSASQTSTDLMYELTAICQASLWTLCCISLITRRENQKVGSISTYTQYRIVRHAKANSAI